MIKPQVWEIRVSDLRPFGKADLRENECIPPKLISCSYGQDRQQTVDRPIKEITQPLLAEFRVGLQSVQRCVGDISMLSYGVKIALRKKMVKIIMQ